MTQSLYVKLCELVLSCTQMESDIRRGRPRMIGQQYKNGLVGTSAKWDKRYKIWYELMLLGKMKFHCYKAKEKDK